MFRPNSPIGRFLSFLADQLTLNLLYMVSCLPIFTAGAAASALYSAQYALAEDRGSGVISLYWQGMRKNFRQSLGLFLIAGMIGVLLALALYAAVIQGLLGTPITAAIAGIVAFIYLGTLSWLFPLQARFEQPLLGQLFNAYAVSIAKLPLTAVMVVLNFWWIPVFFVLPQAYFGLYLFAVTFLEASVSSLIGSRVLLRATESMKKLP